MRNLKEFMNATEMLSKKQTVMIHGCKKIETEKPETINECGCAVTTTDVHYDTNDDGIIDCTEHYAVFESVDCEIG